MNTQTLKNESYGIPISEELSNFIKEYTNTNDRANVSSETGIGTSTVRDVAYRANNLTESNSKAVIALVKIAFQAFKAEKNLSKLRPESIDELLIEA